MMDRLRAKTLSFRAAVRKKWHRNADLVGNASYCLAIGLVAWGGLGLTSGPLVGQRPDPYPYDPVQNAIRLTSLSDAINFLTERMGDLTKRVADQQVQIDAALKEVHESQRSKDKSDNILMWIAAGHLGVYGYKTKKGMERSEE